MIDAWIPRTPTVFFVAALGHPYGPNPERGIFRSTDGGEHFDKVLYTDEYTSGNDVRIDPNDPNTVYSAMWQQQQGFSEDGAYGGTDGGIYKSTDGGNNWRKLIHWAAADHRSESGRSRPMGNSRDSLCDGRTGRRGGHARSRRSRKRHRRRYRHQSVPGRRTWWRAAIGDGDLPSTNRPTGGRTGSSPP